MAWDPELLASLEAALDRTPDQVALRLHVGRLYADGARWPEALGHAEVVLARDPANVEALQLAATGADGCGQAARAAGYRRLLEALGAGPGPAADRRRTDRRRTDQTRSGRVEPPEPGQGHPDQPWADARDPAAVDPAGFGDRPGHPGHPSRMDAEPLAVGDGGEITEAAIDAFLEEVLGADPDMERPGVTLADVGGLDAVKRRLETSFLGPMRNPELRRIYGKSLRGGLLLYGPPGCGKTFLARAVAGELGARFFGIGLHDVLDMWLGKSEQNLHVVFERARRAAPCVLFLDEVDALGMKRSNLAHSAGRNVVVQLLSELDSTRDDNEGVFVLAATNQPWDIDAALRRPGRLDRMLLVLPPDAPARRSILAFHLQDRPVEGSLPLDRLGARTDGYSGADLRLLCEAAAETALEESVRTGDPRPIGVRHFEAALAEVRPSTRPWFEMARNYAMFADDGAYDDLLAYMRRHKIS